jgi:hypothetical protein
MCWDSLLGISDGRQRPKLNLSQRRFILHVFSFVEIHFNLIDQISCSPVSKFQMNHESRKMQDPPLPFD